MTRHVFLMASAATAISLATAYAEKDVANALMPRDPFAKRPYPDSKYFGDSYSMGPFFRKLRRIRVAEGNAAAALKIPATWPAYLARAIDIDPKKWNKNNSFDQWGFWIWHEAQHDSGTLDDEWEMLLYKSIHDVARVEKKYDWMMHVRGNLVVSYFDLCQWANARAILNEAEDYYKSIGLDLDPNKLPAEGGWHRMMPLVKQRKFPLMVPNGRAVVYWQRRESPRDPSKPIYFDNILTSLMLSLAKEDAGMGRWDRAIERRNWVRTWSNAVNKHNSENDKKSKVVRDNEDFYCSAIIGMTEILMDLSFTEKALDLVEDGLTRKSESNYDFRGRINLEIRKERLLVEYGKEDVALIAKMDKFIALEGTSPHILAGSMDTARIYKVQCLRTLGRLDEAEAILHGITEKDQRQRLGWLVAELYLVENMLDRREFAKAKETLQKLLKAIRITGQKIDELALYRAYVSLAFRTENWEEALLAHRELMRLVEAFRMTPLIPQEQAVLSRIMAELGDRAESDRLADLARTGAKGRESRYVEKIERELAARPNAERAIQKSKVQVQPKRIMSVAVEGFPARAVVSLVNHGTREATGVLKVKGLPAKISWDQRSGLGVVEVEDVPGDAAERVSETVRIEAGSMAIFSCSGKLAAAISKTVSLEWIDKGKSAGHCEWIIGIADKESDGAVIDAAEYGDDPFFLIPVHHHLQSKSKGPVNLRVVTSQPCRVEMYDEKGALQMVDSEGNGSLADSADWLGIDRDRNLAAEVLPDTATGETRFLLQLDPKDWKGEEPLRIRVEWLVDGKWFLAAEDQIVSGK